MNFTPFILVQTKMDKDGVGTLQRSERGAQLATELGLACYKEVSAKDGNIDDVIESLIKVVHEPKKALSKEKVKQAVEADSGHNFLGILGN